MMVLFACIVPSTDVFAQHYPEGIIAHWKFDTGSGSYRFVDAFEYCRLQPITRKWYPMDREIRDYVDLIRDNELTGPEFIEQLAADPELRRLFRVPDAATTSTGTRTSTP